MFIAVVEMGTILTSQNGAVWTERESGTSCDLTGIDVVNDSFVAYGATIIYIDILTRRTEATLLTSVDGVSWTIVDDPPNLQFKGIAEGALDIIAVCSNGGILKAAGLELSNVGTGMQVLTGKSSGLQAYKYGDIDKDGVIDMKDILYIMQSMGNLR